MTIEEKIIGFRGRCIDLNKISNPKLAKVFRERIHDGERFLFNYGDHTDYNEGYGDHKEYSDHSEYEDHCDHQDRHKDKSSGISYHYDHECSDGYHSDSSVPSGHTDQHTDKAK